MRQWTIDAFASQPFAGNSACIVEPMDAWPADAWMQSLARENNAGATAFLLRGAKSGRFALRWFTASVEVPLCGHATLAAAHALFVEAGLAETVVAFDTLSGSLIVRRMIDGLEMNFPAQAAKSIEPPPALADALGMEPIEVWAGPYLVAILETSAEVKEIAPDFDLLRAISLAHGGQGNVGIAACMGDAAAFDVIDRFFAPGYGIDEDAATGSFHCILTPIMAARLGRKRIRFHQASPGRGADLTGVLADDRVLLSGTAVTIADSVLRVAPHRLT